MEKNTIVTLDDNTEYALLDETSFDNKKYFFAVKVDKDGKPLKEYEVFEEEIIDKDTYMNTLEDGELKDTIIVSFTNNYMNLVEGIIDNKDAK